MPNFLRPSVSSFTTSVVLIVFNCLDIHFYHSDRAFYTIRIIINK